MKNKTISVPEEVTEGNESTDSSLPVVKLPLWLEKEGGVFFGSGRYELLKCVDELGSLKLASEKLELSYRGAWGKIKRSEEIIGEKLLYKLNNKEGYFLTDFGRKLLEEFEEYYNDVLNYACERWENVIKEICE